MKQIDAISLPLLTLAYALVIGLGLFVVMLFLFCVWWKGYTQRGEDIMHYMILKAFRDLSGKGTQKPKKIKQKNGRLPPQG